MKLNTKEITVMAILTAISIINSRFLNISVPPSSTVLKFQISFSYIIMGIFLGGLKGGITAVIADLLGFFIFNSGNVFYLGFTFNAFLMAFLAGIIMKYTSRLKFNINLLSVFLLTIMQICLFSYLVVNNEPLVIVQSGNELVISYFVKVTIFFLSLITYSVILFFILLNKKKNIDKIILVTLIPQVLVTFFLTPFWVQNLYDVPMLVQMPPRIFKFAIEFPISVYVIYIINERIGNIVKENLNENY